MIAACRFFEDFTLAYVDVGEVALRVRHGGAGPAVLLLHDHPRTHATWHRDELAAKIVRFVTPRRGS